MTLASRGLRRGRGADAAHLEQGWLCEPAPGLVPQASGPRGSLGHLVDGQLAFAISTASPHPRRAGRSPGRRPQGRSANGAVSCGGRGARSAETRALWLRTCGRRRRPWPGSSREDRPPSRGARPGTAGTRASPGAGCRSRRRHAAGQVGNTIGEPAGGVAHVGRRGLLERGKHRGHGGLDLGDGVGSDLRADGEQAHQISSVAFGGGERRPCWWPTGGDPPNACAVTLKAV